MTNASRQIFISYAHTDNEKSSDAQQGWVDRFYETLSIELRQLGLDINFWRDARDLSPNDFFDDRIFSAVENSIVFVAVLSPTYPQRPYCLSELSHFVAHPKIEDPKQAAERVIKVLKSPLGDDDDDASLPESLRRREGFKFFKCDRHANKIIRFWRADGTPTHDEYWDRIYEIATEIARHVRQAPVSGIRNLRSQPGITLYMAEPSADLWPVYRTVRAELEQILNARVLPDRDLPRVDTEIIPVVDDALRASVVSIHLLGETAGYVPDGTLGTPIVHLQLERAAARAQQDRTFRRLIWCNPDISPKSSTQRDLLERLQTGAALLPGDELVRESVEHFKMAAIDIIRKLQEPLSGPRGLHATTPTVFLIYRSDDEGAALVLRDRLYDLGAEVLRPELEGSELEQRKAFEFAATQADCAVVILDNVPEYWVLQTLRQLDDWKSLGRQTPLANRIVFLTGAPATRKTTFRSQLATKVIDATTLPSEEALAGLAQSLALS